MVLRSVLRSQDPPVVSLTCALPESACRPFSPVQLRDRLICCSAVVKPRRFLAQDPEVDYEVMSDEEWEAEPEGEDLLVS